MRRLSLAVGMSLIVAMGFGAPLSAQETTQPTTTSKPGPIAQSRAERS
jgi:hypothetical protein